jgi:hypothetical protein
MQNDRYPRFFGFFAKEFENIRGTKHAPAVLRLVLGAFDRMEKLIQFPVNSDRRRASRARQYAAAWAKVNAQFVPRDATERNLLKAGRRIERRFRHVAACVDALKAPK